RRPHRCDAGQRQRGSGIERKDAAVRVLGANDAHMQHVWKGDVGGERTAARHQRTVLETGHGAADEGHGENALYRSFPQKRGLSRLLWIPAFAGMNGICCPAVLVETRHYLLPAIPAARSAARMRCGVAGNSSIETPNGASASLMALTTAAGAPIAPPSPSPLALVTEACVGVAK